MVSEQTVRENLNLLNNEIRQITDRAITIVAVTKMHPESIYDICINLGIEHIGENRIQELLQKINLRPQARKKFKIHLIGPLQTNKVKFLTGNVDLFDTLSSEETLDKINDRWEESVPLSILFQINCTGEKQKAGLRYDDKAQILQLAKLCNTSNKVRLEGFMTMGPTPIDSYNESNPAYIEDTRTSFKRLTMLRDEMQNLLNMELPRLSMGMTHDYPLAIECGATEIRVGSLLFGERELP